MKKLILLVALLSSLAQAQYIAKIVNGTVQPSHMFEGTGFIQTNNRDFMVRGANNFTAAGQFARYYVGDGNHVVGASYGSGLFFNTYKAPYAMVIKDTSGRVGIGTSNPQAQLHVYPSNWCSLNRCTLFAAGGINVDYAGNTHIVYGDFALDNGGMMVNSTSVAGKSVSVSGDEITLVGENGKVLRITAQGIVFPDGTIQTTAK